MWIAIDFYNYCVTGNVTRTLTGSRVDTKNLPCVMITKELEMEYIVVQDKTGTLSPGAHAGSYNGQDAYNGMLVNAEDRRVQENGASVSTETEGLQGRNGFSEGGVEDETC